MTKWFEAFDEQLWLKPDEQGAEEAAFIIKALRLKPGHAVLDAPCGAGRVAVHIARLGCAVTGVDLRPAFIARSEARFQREGLSGCFLRMDLREMSFCNEFHGIYNWLGSFGYFLDRENFEIALRFAAALRKGGRLLIDQPNREWMLRRLKPKIEKPGMKILNTWNARTQRIESDWVVESDDGRRHNRMSMRLYTAGELSSLVQKAGLTVEALYGDFAAAPYRRGSRRLIVVGRKRIKPGV